MYVAKSRLETLQVKKIIQCIFDNDKLQIEKLVKNGVPDILNYNDPSTEEGITPLLQASSLNDNDMLNFLIGLGADPNVFDFEGKTAIMIAANHGHIDCFETLAKIGADLQKTDKSGKSVLFYCIAATERHAKCMEIALNFKIDINGYTKDGRTVLFAACQTAKDNEETCLAILQASADPNIIQAVTGRTPLMMACGAGSGKVARAMLKLGADPHVADKQGLTAAHYAASCGNFEALVALAGCGSAFDVYDNHLNNPIHLAAKGHANALRFLAQRNCNPKAKNDAGELAKTIAKDGAHKDCGKELRKAEKSFGKGSGKNAEPYSLALYYWTLLWIEELTAKFEALDEEATGAVTKVQAMELLMEMQAPMSPEVEKHILPLFDKNHDGQFDYKDFLTAKKFVNKNYLMAAYEPKKKKKKGGKGKAKKAKIPLDVCVMPLEQIMRPADGGPPIMYIPKETFHTDPERFNSENPPQHPLQDDSAWYLNQPEKQYIHLNDAAKHGDLASIELALKTGYKVDTRNKTYKTPLMTAALHGNLDVCKALIQYGADVNARDNFQWTPLHHAAHAGMIDVVELLLNNGALIDAQAINGGTPLFRAIESSRFNVVEYLIKKGAKVQMENRKGDNAFNACNHWADPRVFEIVETKFNSLPPVKDKKGGGAKGGSGKAKARGSGGAANGLGGAATGGSAGGGGAGDASADTENLFFQRLPSELDIKHNKFSILKAAAQMSAGTNLNCENIVYSPRVEWVDQPTKQQLLEQRDNARERFGWEIDFPDSFKTPFHQNVLQRVVDSGLAED